MNKICLSSRINILYSQNQQKHRRHTFNINNTAMEAAITPLHHTIPFGKCGHSVLSTTTDKACGNRPNSWDIGNDQSERRLKNGVSCVRMFIHIRHTHIHVHVYGHIISHTYMYITSCTYMYSRDFKLANECGSVPVSELLPMFLCAMCELLIKTAKTRQVFHAR